MHCAMTGTFFRKDAGFAVLMIAAAYFEPIESYHTGKSSEGKSKTFFRRGFLRVFSGTARNPETTRVCGRGRCGEKAC